MRIGVPTEIKDHEFRVALTPDGVRDLVEAGHTVLIEAGAGAGSLLPDDVFADAGARITVHAEAVWGDADLVVKVKEPLDAELHHLRSSLTLFTYLHLAGVPGLTEALCNAGVTAIGYETVELDNGYLPLLAPMSDIAGRLAVQVAAHYLEQPSGGSGKLFGGIAGVPPAEVTILGAGTVGRQAATVSMALGGKVTLLDLRVDRLREVLSHPHFSGIATEIASPHAVGESVSRADVVIGAILRAGERAPHIITRDMVRGMQTGAVVVDVAVDQGGCAETTHPTTHSDPVYIEEGVVHYAVTNMPGAVPHTSTFALCNVTLPYILELANEGVTGALKRDRTLALGVNIYKGRLVSQAVGDAVGLAPADLAGLMDLNGAA